MPNPANFLSEARRRRRELIGHEAMQRADAGPVPPQLDAALDALHDEDRQMLLMRCGEQQDWRSIGAAMGLSDDTAQKRVSRALDKVRALLARQGVVKSGAALTGVMALTAVQPAKASSSAQLAAACLTKVGTATRSAWTFAGAAGALGLPVVLLAAGIAVPVSIPVSGSVHMTAKSAGESTAQTNAPAADKAASGAATGTAFDLDSLRAMLHEHNSPLDQLRVRRVLQVAGAEHCLALTTELSLRGRRRRRARPEPAHSPVWSWNVATILTR